MPSRRSPDPFAAQLGARIRQLRKEKKISLSALARASGLSRGHLSEIERGKVVIGIRTLEKLALALEVPAYLICLVPPDDLQVAVVYEAIVAAGGDTRKAAEELRALLAKIARQDAQKECVPNENQPVEFVAQSSEH